MGGLIDNQPLNLVEHRRVRHIRVATIGAARHDDPKRWLGGLHSTDLNWRGVRSQQHPLSTFLFRQIEGVMHLPRRMFRWYVQSRKIMEIVLDIRSLSDCEPHVAKDRDDLVKSLADRVKAAFHLRAHRQGDVDPVSDQSLLPHIMPVPWEEVYADWPSDEYQYYWRDWEAEFVDYDYSYNEKRDRMAFELAEQGDKVAISALQRIIARDQDVAKIARAECLLAQLEEPA